MQTLNRKNHSTYRINYHVIFVIKYRHKLLNEELLDRMENILRDTLSKWECHLIEFNGEADHVHLLIDCHPSLNLSRLIGNLKTVTARHLRKEYVDYLAKYFWKPYFWSKSYSVISTGGANLETVKKYIINQEKPVTSD